MVLQRILRAGEGKIVKRLRGIANAVNSIEEDFLAMTDAELRGETDVFRKRVADGGDAETRGDERSRLCARPAPTWPAAREAATKSHRLDHTRRTP